MSTTEQDYLAQLEGRLVAEQTGEITEGRIASPSVSFTVSGPEPLNHRSDAPVDGSDTLKGFPRPLFNPTAPAYEVKHEQPEHRIITFLKAQGLSNREIAARTGFSTIAVGYILKQPWAQRQLLTEIETAGRDGVHELLKGAVADCVVTLIGIQADEKAKNSDRVAASNSILDRFFGRPTQRVESVNTNVSGTIQDVKKMQADLAEVEAEIQRVTGGPGEARAASLLGN